MPVLAKADTDTEAVIRNDVDDDAPMAVTVPTVEKLVRHARAEDRDAVAIIVRRQCMVILVERIVLRLLRVPRSAAIFILLGSFMFMDHRRRRAAAATKRHIPMACRRTDEWKKFVCLSSFVHRCRELTTERQIEYLTHKQLFAVRAPPMPMVPKAPTDRRMDYIRLRRNNVICPNSLILMLIMSLSNIVPNIVSIIEESRFHFAFDERHFRHLVLKTTTWWYVLREKVVCCVCSAL